MRHALPSFVPCERIRRRDLGLGEYYPRFMAQGMHDVDEARASRQLDGVLETVGMDCNPGYGRSREAIPRDESVFRRARAASLCAFPPAALLAGRRADRQRWTDRHAETDTKPPKPPHARSSRLSRRHVSKFKRALAASGGADAKVAKKQKTSASADPARAPDPAAAVRAAMAAAKARGGGVVGGGDAVKRAPGSVSGGGNVCGLAAASEAEVTEVLARHRARDFLRLLGFPGAPVDERGKCDWKTHPVSKPGDVALRAKLLCMRLDPDLPGASPLASAARDAAAEAARLLDDKETKKEILTLAVRRRVDEMRRKNIGDVRGGYVSVTGVHYAAGAAAARVSDYKADDAGEGPAMNPAARLRAGAAAVEKRGIGGDRTEDPPVARDGPVDDAAAGAPPFPRAQTAKPRKVDLGSIRDKLKKKKTAPRFM